jgi:hypothetical protein
VPEPIFAIRRFTPNNSAICFNEWKTYDGMEYKKHYRAKHSDDVSFNSKSSYQLNRELSGYSQNHAEQIWKDKTDKFHYKEESVHGILLRDFRRGLL